MAPTIKQIRARLRGQPVTIYRAGIVWDGIPSESYNTIVAAPTTNQYDILRMERTNGANYGLSTEVLIVKLQELDNQIGVDITGAVLDGVEFFLRRVPRGAEAQELGNLLLQLCPDLFEAPRRFRKGKVTLWWD